MRILYLNPSGKLGGAETSLLALLGGLRALRPGWELRLLTAEDGPVLERARALGVEAEALPFPEALGRAGRGGGSGWLPLAGPACGYALALRRRVREIAPDIVQTNGYKMHLLGAWVLPRKALVCHMHDYVDRGHIAGRLMRSSLGRFTAVVANSRSVAADLDGGRKTDRIRCIHNGVDLSRFTPGTGAGTGVDLDALSGLAAAAPGTVRIGLVATFAKWKGHGTFLRAVARLPRDLPFRAYIIGGPIYRTKSSQHSFEGLRAEAEALGIAGNVGFTGFLDDPVAAMRSLDVVVHASTEPEPFGMVLIEAMACGKALVASNAGGAREIFDDGATALGHAPGDEAGLAAQLHKLIADGGLRREMGRKARMCVEARFSSSVMAARFADLYSSMAPGLAATSTARTAEGSC